MNCVFASIVSTDGSFYNTWHSLYENYLSTDVMSVKPQ
jgi:hypothetical protein